jgi:hypothetical protein
MEQPSARITVRRNAPSDVGHRQVIMSIDGKPLFTLLNGQWATREIEPGPHTLKAYNTLISKTIDFMIEPGEHVEFLIANVVGRWAFSALALLGVGPMGLRFEKTESERPT